MTHRQQTRQLWMSTCSTICTQVRLNVGEDGAVDASYTEVPLQTLPLPIEIRAVPLDYFDVSPQCDCCASFPCLMHAP